MSTYRCSLLLLHLKMSDVLAEILFPHTSVGVCWAFFSDFGKSLLPLLFKDSWNRAWIDLVWYTTILIQVYVFKCSKFPTIKPSQMKRVSSNNHKGGKQPKPDRFRYILLWMGIYIHSRREAGSFSSWLEKCRKHTVKMQKDNLKEM